MCRFCFEDKREVRTTFTVEYNGCVIVIRNVPCLECQNCGEIMFTDKVSEELERIVNAAKAVLQDVSVIDYAKVA